MLPEFYTLYSVVKVLILLYKSSAFMTDVSTMIVISDQAGFSDGLPLIFLSMLIFPPYIIMEFLLKMKGF